jgi:hypothetical protein
MRGTIPPLPQYVFMAWCSVKAQGHLYPYLLTLHFIVGMKGWLCTVKYKGLWWKGERQIWWCKIPTHVSVNRRITKFFSVDVWRNCIWHTRCSHEFIRIILVQVSYLYTYSLLRGVNFKVPPLSSCALGPTMMPLLETSLELLLWNFFQCCHHIFLCLQYPEIFIPLRQILFLEKKKKQKSFGAESGEWDVCFTSVIEFWTKELLDREHL